MVDLIPTKITISNDREFYGLYNSGFPKRPWFSNKELFFNTNQKYTINSYLINIGKYPRNNYIDDNFAFKSVIFILDSGIISELSYDDGSQLVLDTKGGLVLVLRRNFLVPDVVAIGKLAQADSTASVEWMEITGRIEVPEINGSVYKYFDLISSEGSVSK